MVLKNTQRVEMRKLHSILRLNPDQDLKNASCFLAQTCYYCHSVVPKREVFSNKNANKPNGNKGTSK